MKKLTEIRVGMKIKAFDSSGNLRFTGTINRFVNPQHAKVTRNGVSSSGNWNIYKRQSTGEWGSDGSSGYLEGNEVTDWKKRLKR